MQPYLTSKVNMNDAAVVAVIDELPLWSAPFGLKLLDTVIMRSKMNVLDIGCGLGFPLIELAHRLGATCNIIGIDVWEQAIERIHLKIKTQRLKNVTVVCDRAEDMPFKDDFFDLIVSNNGINNIEDPNKVLTQCFRTSRHNAQMVLTYNLPDTMIEFYRLFEETLAELGKSSEIDRVHQHIYEKRKPLPETIAMIEKAGFKVKNTIHDSFAIRCLDGTTMLNHFLIRIGFLESWKAILSPHDIESVFSVLENKLNKFAAQRGDLSLQVPWVCIDCYKN